MVFDHTLHVGCGGLRQEEFPKNEHFVASRFLQGPGCPKRWRRGRLIPRRGRRCCERIIPFERQMRTSAWSRTDPWISEWSLIDQIRDGSGCWPFCFFQKIKEWPFFSENLVIFKKDSIGHFWFFQNLENGRGFKVEWSKPRKSSGQDPRVKTQDQYE